MSEAEAIRWLQSNGLAPWDCSIHGDKSGEARWYPAAGSNLTSSFFDGCPHCLLPLAVYEALEFPKPLGWEDKPYPWFPSCEAAMLAAAKAISQVAKQA